jgi:hypothetical protein
MPSRRHPKTPSRTASTQAAAQPAAGTTAATPVAGRPSDVERFAAALKDSEKADRARKAREQQERADAAHRAEQAAEKANALKSAQRELARAVDGVRSAKERGKGRAEADEAWKVAKARVIELETGTAPSWAPKPVAAPASGDSVESSEESDPVGVEAAADPE